MRIGISRAATGLMAMAALAASTPAMAIPAMISPVPEPGTWAMMILGFGLAGMGLRRAATRSSASARKAVRDL